jgi:hypothetical protein
MCLHDGMTTTSQTPTTPQEARDQLWGQAVAAVSAAAQERDSRIRADHAVPPHTVNMRNRYSGNLVDAFYFNTKAQAQDFIRLLRQARYAGTKDTDYTLSYSDRYAR